MQIKVNGKEIEVPSNAQKVEIEGEKIVIYLSQPVQNYLYYPYFPQARWEEPYRITCDTSVSTNTVTIDNIGTAN